MSGGAYGPGPENRTQAGIRPLAREHTLPEVVGKVGQDPELAAHDPERLGVAEPLDAARQPVLLHEGGELVDDLLRIPHLVRKFLFLGECESLIGTGDVQHCLSGGEQRREQEPIELIAPQELGAPLKPPAPDRELADRLQREVGETAHAGVHRSCSLYRG